MTVTGVLATHYHPDHVGGSMMGYQIEGIAKLLELGDVPIHVNRHEKPWVEKTTGVSGDNLVAHEGGDSITVGKVSVTFVHTPGHTPGSQCFLVDGCLIAGDTLFLDGCGRTDLPGSDPALMYESLTMLNELPSHTKIFPGHHYSAPTSETLEQVRQHNFVLKPMNREQWLSIFS
jgi:glyoxylase-like metal-dependent hydrolase (beta-lactamase superfamily II)